jgi:hypothetical protein
MRARKPTEICITVDTEFSIGGNFYNPEFLPVAEPIVLGAIDGKEHGLGFLLESFCEFGVRATFFVEALQTAYFGDEPMRTIARRIAAAGHDVQLHLHPCWLHYEQMRARPKKEPNDSCAGRSDGELDNFFATGLAAFSRWGLPKPIAVRSGNFQVDANFYRATARSGLSLSSSVALGAWRPAEEELFLPGGKHRIGQVVELPVFTYSDNLGYKKRSRILSITASSYAEVLSVLRQARDRGVSPVIIVTHPQEFVKRKHARYAMLPWHRVNQDRLKDVLQYSTLRHNRVSQIRLKSLLRFLCQAKDQFVTVPISAISYNGSASFSTCNPLASVSAATTVARILENGINDRIWRY